MAVGSLGFLPLWICHRTNISLAGFVDCNSTFLVRPHQLQSIQRYSHRKTRIALTFCELLRASALAEVLLYLVSIDLHNFSPSTRSAKHRGLISAISKPPSQNMCTIFFKICQICRNTLNYNFVPCVKVGPGVDKPLDSRVDVHFEKTSGGCAKCRFGSSENLQMETFDMRVGIEKNMELMEKREESEKSDEEPVWRPC